MALPIKKRPYSGSNYSVAKRLKRVEYVQRANRPEMQTATYTQDVTIAADGLAIIPLCQISQGDGISERHGNNIKIWRVEVRGVTRTGIDHYLIQQRTTTAPNTAVFGASAGAFLLNTENNTRFTEWKYYQNYTANGRSVEMVPIRFSQKFKGMNVRYNGSVSTAVVENELVYCAYNRTLGTLANEVSIRIWFTDP